MPNNLKRQINTSENINSQYINDKGIHLNTNQGNANYNINNNYFPITREKKFK